MTDVVLIDASDGVALMTLNRPDRLNAWNAELQVRYFDLLEECARREDVRAIVVTGAGRGFCAGADMQNLEALSEGDGQLSGVADQRTVALLLDLPKPIIAAINGACAGLGLAMALMCDLRFAATEAKLTTAFVRRGLIAEYGMSWILPRLVGPARALDLLFSGRVVLGAEAETLGLVNRAVGDGRVVDEAMRYARELASECSPTSMATMKRQVYGDAARSLEASMADANQLMVDSLARADFTEGVQSFLERRSPRFAPLSL